MATRARNSEYTKEYNRNNFIRILRNKSLSRSELARKLGLTRSAASLIVDELINDGFILKEENKKPMGRVSLPLMLNSNRIYSIGVFLTRKSCKIGIVDLCGNVVSSKNITCNKPEDLDILSSTINDLIDKNSINRNNIVGVGISAPGPLDGESGKLCNPPGFEAWHNVQITNILKEKLKLPVYLANDAVSLAQYNLGKKEANNSENFLLLLVNEGIGSGVVIRGKVLKGQGYFTGELGHTSINYNGKNCICGNRGCLEAYASITNLLDGTSYSSWKEVIDNYPTSSLAKELVDKEVEYLSIGIVNLINLISVDTILLAGDLLYKANIFASLLEENINKIYLRRDAINIKVLPSCEGENIPLCAAADIAFNAFLSV